MNSSPGAGGRPLRALIVAYCFPPHGAIGTHRTLRLVQRLDREGWQTEIVTPAPAAYAEGTPIDPAFLARVPSSVRVTHTSVWRPLDAVSERAARFRNSSASGSGPAAPASGADAPVRQPGRLAALRGAVRAATSIPDQDIGWLVPAAVAAARRSRPDVIYSSGPPYTGHLAALLASRVLRRPWVADFRDPWSRAPWRSEHQAGAVRAVHGWLEARVVRAATAVVFTTDSAREEFAAFYGPRLAAKFVTVRNGCDASLFQAAPPKPLDGVFTLLHAGSLYGGRDPRPLIRAVGAAIASQELPAERFRLVFLGRAELADIDIPAEIRAAGLTPLVTLIPRAPHAESLRMMQDASALLLLQPGTKLSIPGKLYEYFAAGRPVLALADPGETADLVTRSGAGIVADPDDEAAIAKALVRLYRGVDKFEPAEAALFDGDSRAAELARVLAKTAAPSAVEATPVPPVHERRHEV